jgi:hypothetical protein
LADGKAEAFSDLRTMLAIASAIPGRMDGRGNIKPVDFDADGDDEP